MGGRGRGSWVGGGGGGSKIEENNSNGWKFIHLLKLTWPKENLHFS